MPALGTARHRNEQAHVHRYEKLRRQGGQQQLPAGRLGLSVLLDQGLAAWMELEAKMLPQTQMPSTKTSKSSALPDDTRGDIVNLLTAMALGHLQEEHT